MKTFTLRGSPMHTLQLRIAQSTFKDSSRDSSWYASHWFVAVLTRGILVTLLSLGACVDSSAPTPAPVPAEDIPTRIIVTPDAMVMAVGDTLDVTVVAQNTFGDTINMEGVPVTWTSADAGIVTVTPDGAVVAHKPTTSYEFVQLTARWTKNSATIETYIFVNVTPERIPIAGLKIHADSNRTSMVTQLLSAPSTWVNVIAVDANGDSIAALRVILAPDARTSPSEVNVGYLGELGILFGGGPYLLYTKVIGDYWLHARSTIYGVPMDDSLKFVGLYPADAVISIAQDSASASPISLQRGQTLSVQPCAQVNFKNDSRTPIDIVFDDSTKTGQCVPWDQVGNIRAIPVGGSDFRKFPATGTIKWTVHNPQTGAAYPGMSGNVQMRTP